MLRADELDDIERLLIPVAHPDQACAMIELAGLFEKGRFTHIGLLHVLAPRLDEDMRKERLDELYEGLEELGVGDGGRRERGGGQMSLKDLKRQGLAALYRIVWVCDRGVPARRERFRREREGPKEDRP